MQTRPRVWAKCLPRMQRARRTRRSTPRARSAAPTRGPSSLRGSCGISPPQTCLDEAREQAAGAAELTVVAARVKKRVPRGRRGERQRPGQGGVSSRRRRPGPGAASAGRTVSAAIESLRRTKMGQCAAARYLVSIGICKRHAVYSIRAFLRAYFLRPSLARYSISKYSCLRKQPPLENQR